MTFQSKILLDAWEQLRQEGHTLVTEELFDAVQQAVEALEQEPILDKIRAEIEQKLKEPMYQHEGEDWMVGLIIAQEIIDKYKAEIEPQESEVSDADSN